MANTDLHKIVLITSPVSKTNSGIILNDYFTSLVTLLVKNLQKQFAEADIVIKIPKSSDGAAHLEQLEILKQAASKQDVDYIILIPFDVLQFRDKNLLRKVIEPLIKAKRLIFVDQGFEYKDEDFIKMLQEEQLELPPYVQANWIQGGETAGASATKYLKDNEIESPNIVLIEGNIGSQERIKGFLNHIEEMRKQAETSFYPSYTTIKGEYNKMTAKEKFALYLSSVLKSLTPIDLIFATNDEMGLGIRDALFERHSEYLEKIATHRKGNMPKIIGFDGIVDFTSLINKGGEDFVHDTVYVDIEKQVEEVVRIISNHNKHRNINESRLRMCTVNCISFRKKFVDHTPKGK